MEPADPKSLPQAIIRSGRAAPTVAQLARTLGIDAVQVEAFIVEAFDAGTIDVWPGEEERVTLSPLSAEAFGVRLDPNGKRWESASRRVKPGRITNAATITTCETDLSQAWIDRDSFDGLPPPVFDRMPDPQAWEAHLVHDATELAERMASGIRGRVNNGIGELNIPLPTVLLGQRLQWPCSAWQTSDARPKVAGDCPGCSGNLRPHEYCLICDGYGRGWMLPRVKAERIRQLPRETRPADKPRAIRRAEKFARPG